MDIRGKTVLLTGATGGLGRAMALRLAGSGAKLILSARNPDALEALEAELPGAGHSTLAADLGEAGAASELAASAGNVDCLVANAALPATGRITELSDEQVARMLRVNLESPILLTQALLPGMLDRGSGKLVLIGSLAGKTGSPRSSVYNASKFGLRGFAFGLSGDLTGTGVSVTVVAPGFIRDAGMFADSGAKAPPHLGTASPDEVSDALMKAIESEKIEITVAPLKLRAVAHASLVSPTLSYRFQSGPAGQKTADIIARGQTGKR
jgi:short-subunit dehydrogenase